MSYSIDDTYKSRMTNKDRKPNSKGDFPPFVAKVKDGFDRVAPIYTPYDATDEVQGVTWLTDNLAVSDDFSKDVNRAAGKGMTAITPYGVRQKALCIKTRKSNEVTLEGNKSSHIYYGGTLHVSSLQADNVSGTSTTNPMVKVNFLKTGKDKDGNSTWLASGTTTGTKEDNYFSLNLDFDTLPADKLPATIPASHIKITQDMLPNIPLEKLPPSVMERVTLVNSHKDMLNLTIDDIQNGDAVKINSTSDAEEGYAGKIYLVYDETKLGSDDAFVEFSAGTAATAARADEATMADKAKALDHSVVINFTGAVEGSLTTDFAETFLDDVELTIHAIEKTAIEDAFGVKLE